MSNKHLPGLVIRKGGIEDLPVVKAICADVWEGNDYVPYAWAEWSGDPNCQPYIFELDEQPAGLYCMRTGYSGPDSGWIQGVRVATAYKRRGLAAAIISHAIKLCREQNLRLLHYTTASDNEPMHRLAERNGFSHMGTFLNWPYRNHKKPRPAPLPARLVIPSEFDGAYNLILNSSEYLSSRGYYCNAWHWKPLSIDALREHIERREVYSPNGALTALAIMTRGEEGDFWLAYLVGDLQAQKGLLSELTRKVLALTPPGQEVNFTAQLPRTIINENLLVQYDFERNAHESHVYLYELRIEPRRKPGPRPRSPEKPESTGIPS